MTAPIWCAGRREKAPGQILGAARRGDLSDPHVLDQSEQRRNANQDGQSQNSKTTIGFTHA